MRMSTLFGLTLREAPSGVEVASHGLLLQAGFIRQLAAGIFSYLPLTKRSIGKIEKILREEMDAAGRRSRCPSCSRPMCGRDPAGKVRWGMSW
jgi:prolyl-tRNA synthetase